MPRNIGEFFKHGGKIENWQRKVCVTTEKMAKAQPSSSKLFCFSGLLIPLGNNLFEEEESIKYFEEKCVCYGFNKYYQIRFETPQAETFDELIG